MALLPFQPSPDIPRGVRQKPGIWTHKKDSSMYKRFVVGLAVLSLVAAVPLLSACHTTAGAGQDISATGKVIEKSAKQSTP
jgi:predicted small secreted protein